MTHRLVPIEPTKEMVEAMDQAVFTHGNVIDAYKAMLATAPSNANTSGMEVVGWMRLTKGQITHLTHLKQPGYVPLVTAASAQARIEELEAEIAETIAERSRRSVAWQRSEARADRLAKALEAARETLNAIDCPLTTDRTVAGAAKHAVKRIDAALQQETQP